MFKCSAANCKIYYSDTLPPAIILPALDTIVSCDGLGNLAELQSWLDNNGGADASELCGDTFDWTHDYTEEVYQL